MDNFLNDDLNKALDAILELTVENKSLQQEIEVLRNTLYLLEKVSKKYDSEYKPLTKNPTEMTTEELIEANKGVTSRIKPKATSTEKLPMATDAQCQQLAIERALQASTSLEDPIKSFLIDYFVNREKIGPVSGQLGGKVALVQGTKPESTLKKVKGKIKSVLGL